MCDREKPKQSDKKVSNIGYYECESSIGYTSLWFFIIQKKYILVFITKTRSTWFSDETDKS
jgi:hypothetical protein